MVIRNIGPRTETEVWEIGAETGVEYPKKLGIDIADGVAENIEDVAATTSCLFFAKRCHCDKGEQCGLLHSYKAFSILPVSAFRYFSRHLAISG